MGVLNIKWCKTIKNNIILNELFLKLLRFYICNGEYHKNRLYNMLYNNFLETDAYKYIIENMEKILSIYKFEKKYS